MTFFKKMRQEITYENDQQRLSFSGNQMTENRSPNSAFILTDSLRKKSIDEQIACAVKQVSRNLNISEEKEDS